MLTVSNPQVRVMAVKRAEEGNEVVVRMVEETGKPQSAVRVTFPVAIASAREINGAEEEVGAATVTKGELVTDFTGYQPRTFAIKLSDATAKVAAPQSQPVSLTYDKSVATADHSVSTGGFDAEGKSLPGEMLPAEIAYDGITFHLAPATEGKLNAVTADGQTINLPEGSYDRLYLLAASYGGDQHSTFQIGSTSVPLTIQDWSGYIGQWDNRQWKTIPVPPPATPTAGDNSKEAQRALRTLFYIKTHGPIMKPSFVGLTPGFIKRAPVAWYASHLHSTDGSNAIYNYSYLYAYTVDVPAGAKTLTLPTNDHIRILAITAAAAGEKTQPAQPLYDTLVRTDDAAQ
jgi:alpha-mannosidase